MMRTACVEKKLKNMQEKGNNSFFHQFSKQLLSSYYEPSTLHWRYRSKQVMTSTQDRGIGRHTLPPYTTIEGSQLTSKQKTPRTARKLNCMKVQQPRI